jgi:hypothetical protein
MMLDANLDDTFLLRALQQTANLGARQRKLLRQVFLRKPVDVVEGRQASQFVGGRMLSLTPIRLDPT